MKTDLKKFFQIRPISLTRLIRVQKSVTVSTAAGDPAGFESCRQIPEI
jgi:hypothetical protein